MTAGAADQTPFERGREAPERTRRGQAEQRELEQRELEQHERFGPLSLLRTRKGDGRALLLFNHPAEEGER